MISNRTKALIIVDVQPSFLNERNQYIVKNICKLLDDVRYDIYFEATFHAEKGSVWDVQQQWICPTGEETRTVKVLSDKLEKFNPIHIRKETKSVFKGEENVVKILREKNIEEVHIVGVDTNDCVLATAYESFDLGFITYVVEACCQSSASDKLHEYALELLRAQNMTDASTI